MSVMITLGFITARFLFAILGHTRIVSVNKRCCFFMKHRISLAETILMLPWMIGRKRPWCYASTMSIWVRSRNCSCLVTWFCYRLIAKPGNKTATVSWPDPYIDDIGCSLVVIMCQSAESVLWAGVECLWTYLCYKAQRPREGGGQCVCVCVVYLICTRVVDLIWWELISVQSGHWPEYMCNKNSRFKMLRCVSIEIMYWSDNISGYVCVILQNTWSIKYS